MFEVSKLIYGMLNGNAGLMAIATKIFPLIAPQDQPAPFVNYFITENSAFSKEGKYSYMITIRCYAEEYDEALQLCDAVKSAVKDSALTFKFENTTPFFENGEVYTESNYQLKN